VPEARAIDVDLDDTAMSEASAVLERFTRAASTP